MGGGYNNILACDRVHVMHEGVRMHADRQSSAIGYMHMYVCDMVSKQ